MIRIKIGFIILSILFFIACNSDKKKEYYKSGALKAEYEVAEFMKNGDYKSYFENGVLQEESIYLNNKYNGVVKIFYKNGKPDWEANYTNGLLNGVFKDYSEDGILESEGYFKNGLQDSITKFFQANGKIQSEQLWKEGKKNGYFKEYNTKGDIKFYALFDNDSSIYWEEYNANGEVEKFHRAINIISKRDTIKKGEVFQGQIHVFGPNLENVEIMISLAPYGVFKEKLKYIKIPVKNGIANYTLKPDKIGNYFIDVTVVDDRLPAYIEEKTRDVFVINK